MATAQKAFRFQEPLYNLGVAAILLDARVRRRSLSNFDFVVTKELLWGITWRNLISRDGRCRLVVRAANTASLVGAPAQPVLNICL